MTGTIEVEREGDKDLTVSTLTRENFIGCKDVILFNILLLCNYYVELTPAGTDI